MSYHEDLGGEHDKLSGSPPKCTEMLQKECKSWEKMTDNRGLNEEFKNKSFS